MSNVQCVVNNWLVGTGFTVGVQDTIATTAIKNEIRKIVKNYSSQVTGIIDEAQSGNLELQPGKDMLASFEAKVNKVLNEARDKSGNLAFKSLDRENRLRNMVFAGSKGS